MCTEPDAGMPAPSRRLFIVGAVLSGLAAAALWITCYLLWWDGFRGDTYAYGDIARNVLAGRGYVSRAIWLNDLAVGRPPYQYPVHRSPLAALSLVPGMAVWGRHSLAVLFPSLVCYVALAAMVWWVGVRWLGTLGGACAALLFLLNYNVLQFALSGLPTLLFATIVTCLLLVLVRCADRISGVALAGALAGLGYLVRPNMLFIAAGLAVAVAFADRRGLRKALLMGVAALLVCSPYLAANLHHTGSLLASSQKFITLFNTRSFPGASVYDHVEPPEPAAFYRRHPEQLIDKLEFYAGTVPRTFWTAFRLTGVTFGLVGLFWAGASEPMRRLRVLLIAALAGQAACDLITHNNARFLVPFVPAVSLFAGLGLSRILEGLWNWRRSAAAMAGAVVLLVSIRSWWMFPEILDAEFGPTDDRRVAQVVLEEIGDRDELVAASNAAAITWYADQRTVGLSSRPEEMLKAEGYLGPIPWLLVSGEHYERWTEAITAMPQLEDRYELVQTVVRDGRIVAALYRRQGEGGGPVDRLKRAGGDDGSPEPARRAGGARVRRSRESPESPHIRLALPAVG